MEQREGSMASNQVAYPQKRRSSRIEKAIALAVQGVDASRAPFREEVTTVAISCHGCSCQMKHEVLPGTMVVLDMGLRANGRSEWPARARVKWIRKENNATDASYGIAMEFESAGNIWGIASPPEDWLPLPGSKAEEPPNLGRELRLVARTEPPTVPARTGRATPVSLLKKSEAVGSLSPWFSDLMAGISNQVQVTVCEIAAVTLANERSRLLDEFRTQLHNEAAGTIEHVIETSKEELARRGLKVLNEATEITVRSSHERLIGAIEQDLENAKQRMLIQGDELTQRVDGMAARTIEQLQRTIETTRTEAAARFVSRLREQVAPILDEAKADLQRLVASQTVFKEESQTIYARVTSELENGVNAKLVQAHDELDKKSSEVLTECNEKLLSLSNTFENVARDSVQTLIASATDTAKKNLEERAAEISSNFTGELEGHMRDYLEFISDSIAEFPKKNPAP
jgi:hypothetical protein